MAKKAAKTATFSNDASTAGAVPKKASASRTPKHLKAQASGVVAAVEGFVSALTNTPVEEETELVEAPVERAIPEIAGAPAPVAPEVEPTKIEAVAPQKQAAAPQKEVTEEDIRVLAYTFYLNRRAEGGSEAEDWLRAEQTLKST